ncbi:MAG TPA: zinc ribbon domain-containing protein [Candidatus Desulfofervidus auxilii]|uniref:Zinc ribbon domain-containing protein n=1 Tax=Desulfofervidus auxilii TaxID=1621989 RepID=A0A7V0I9K0_DESA2|nr:zinc ribbon domain-containing protein [Candidatus Desulfofervidus auxilii]
MPIYEFCCQKCGYIFERIQTVNDAMPKCPVCGSKTRRLISTVSFKVASNEAVKRVEKRFKDYIRWGKYKDAAKFADKAAQYIKDDKIKRIQEGIHKKLEKRQGAYRSKV